MTGEVLTVPFAVIAPCEFCSICRFQSWIVVPSCHVTCYAQSGVRLSSKSFHYPEVMRDKRTEPVSLEELAAEADDAYVFTDEEDENE